MQKDQFIEDVLAAGVPNVTMPRGMAGNWVEVFGVRFSFDAKDKLTKVEDMGEVKRVLSELELLEKTCETVDVFKKRVANLAGRFDAVAHLLDDDTRSEYAAFFEYWGV